MTKPKIVAIKHKQPAKKKKEELTALEESVLEEVSKRGEPAPEETEEQEGQGASGQAVASDAAEQKKPKVVEKKDYPLAEAPAEKKTSIVKVQEDIVREMREQAVKDILPVRKEIGRPLEAGKPGGEKEETVPLELEKKRLVDEAIRKHEEKEREKSFVGRLLKRIGFS